MCLRLPPANCVFLWHPNQHLDVGKRDDNILRPLHSSSEKAAPLASKMVTRRSFSKLRKDKQKENGGRFPMRSIPTNTSPAAEKGNSSHKKSPSKLSCALKALKCSSRAKKSDHEEWMKSPKNGTVPLAGANWEAQFNIEEELASSGWEKLPFNDRSERPSTPRDDMESLEAATTDVNPNRMQIGSQLVEDRIHIFEDSPNSAMECVVDKHSDEDMEVVHHVSDDDEHPDSDPPTPVADRRQPEEITEKTLVPDLYAKSDDSESQFIPRRIASEDTHDTPQASNVHPIKTHNKAENEMDVGCQKYFDSLPPKEIMHTGLSLGDSITPTGSPAGDDRSARHFGANNPSVVEDAKRKLQLPSMIQNSMSFGSKSDCQSPLLGEVIADEKKVENDYEYQHRANKTNKHGRLDLSPDLASVKIGHQEVRASISNAKSTGPGATGGGIIPLESKKSSSFSSVSSFVEVAGAKSHRGASDIRRYNHPTRAGAITPHPFFWRSHPNAAEMTTQRQQPPPPPIPKYKKSVRHIPPISTHSYSPFGNLASSPRFSIQEEHETSTVSGASPCLHPGVVRKMWLESKPFRLEVNSNWRSKADSDRHPLGPPSPRANNLIESLTSFANIPAVFNRTEPSTRGRHS